MWERGEQYCRTPTAALSLSERPCSAYCRYGSVANNTATLPCSHPEKLISQGRPDVLN